MNIWAWVRETRARLEQGDPQAQRLAELMRALPSAAGDEAHERVDAMTPEAIALARELDEPWVELFIRHWSLQSRVLHRRCAGDELRDAVSLLDFSNGARTKGCPQGVCAVQDLAVCYAIRDGPGYVQERLAVARETLTRIDPTWACFDCISAEYFSALMDDDRPAEALAFIEAQAEQQAEHGEFEPGYNMIANRARALAELGHGAQALALLDAIPNVARYGRGRLMSHRQSRVALLLAVDRLDEALALHPPLSAIRATAGHFRDWVDNLATLIDRGRLPNTAQVGRELLEVQRRLEQNGARWDTATTALTAAGLALARGALVVTALLLADFDRVVVTLRRPELLAARRRELGEALELATLAHDNQDEQDEHTKPEHTEPERDLDRLDRARREAPNDPELAIEHAAALRQIGRPDLARALLEREAGASERATVELARSLLAEHDHAALDELLGSKLDGRELALCWIYGESLRERGELERAIAFDRKLLQTAPGITRLRLRLAANARTLGDWETALAALDAAAESGELEPGSLDWDRITAATVLGRWATVRAAAARLGFLVSANSEPDDGDSPIDLDLGLIRCEFVEASGERQRYWARRTSPCGARVVEIAMPSDPQHYGDRVAFEPVNLEASQGSQAPRRPCFEVVAIVEPGRSRSFLLRGFDPGPERFEALRLQVRAAGYGFERITSEGRSAPDPRGDRASAAELPTVAVLIAIPEHDDPARLRTLVTDASADWELPLLDPRLDAAAAEPEAAAEATALLERWKP